VAIERLRTNDKWILVTGCARSGTKWISDLLNDSKQACIVLEQFPEIRRRTLSSPGGVARFDIEAARSAALALARPAKKKDDVAAFGQKQPFPIDPIFLSAMLLSGKLMVLNIHRHPIDVLLSISKRRITPGDDFSMMPAFETIEHCADIYAMNQSFVASLHPSMVIDICYEELLAWPDPFCHAAAFIGVSIGADDATESWEYKRITTDKPVPGLGCVNSRNRKDFSGIMPQVVSVLESKCTEAMRYWGYRLS
jgi:hypothetical protein